MESLVSSLNALLSRPLSGGEWLILTGGAYLIGLNKAGLRGVNIVLIPFFAAILGGKTSASVILPLLLTGDVCALFVYRKKAEFFYLKKMLPLAVAGLAAGTIIGNRVDDRVFTLLVACFVLVCLILMAYREIFGSNLVLPDHWAAHGAAGFMGGLTTMMGNAAGPIMAAYLLALNLPKEIFIGTGTVFFFIVNVLKLPVHALVWKSMTGDTLILSAVLAPLVLLGMFTGLPFIKRIPEKPFRIIIMVTATAGSIKLFF